MSKSLQLHPAALPIQPKSDERHRLDPNGGAKIESRCRKIRRADPYRSNPTNQEKDEEIFWECHRQDPKDNPLTSQHIEPSQAS